MTMLLPLIILAIASVVGGFMGFPHASWIEGWLEPVIPVHEGASLNMMAGMEYILMAVSVIGAAAGIFVARNIYMNLKVAEGLKKRFSVLHKTLENKWYIDEIYEATLVRPIQMLSQALWKGFDVAVIDRIVVGFGKVSEWSGQTIRVIQTGSIQIYAFALLLGIIATVGYLIHGMV
jgi:NADH-quinone oxidoreductase subunit L